MAAENCQLEIFFASSNLLLLHLYFLVKWRTYCSTLIYSMGAHEALRPVGTMQVFQADRAVALFLLLLK